MDFISVEDLMIPVAEFATISEDATLYEAVMKLKTLQGQMEGGDYRPAHRAILVFDRQGKIVGKISQLDVLRALEPKYSAMGDTRALSRAGLSVQFLRSMMENFNLCDTSLSDMCGKGARIRVKDFMYSTQEGECVEAEASLCEAIHMLIMGQHQKLLVVRGKEIVGVLRLADVFGKVYDLMAPCET